MRSKAQLKREKKILEGLQRVWQEQSQKMIDWAGMKIDRINKLLEDDR
ncbi:hypothetical protein LCGC14_1697500 [marine sediment metagenome]|uniref:Uncharacterized protein n=1 Tax=marine sediment metagenome TaxID=412755 RepID=A0A0F9KIZ8_9ZZZZ